ncbi:MAG TPA: glucan biosynthesis protein G [Candidatus Limnocylindria bacterium]|nr:glucan biosynthesis protein G [Candidatus Limnocylindria bacterium]
MPRTWLTLVMGVALLAAGGERARAAFDLDTVATHARQLAQAPFDDPQRVPEWLAQISYDQWRDIRYRADTALWKGSGSFTVQFFHPGLFYNRTVNVNVVDSTGVHPVPFSPSHFDYGRNDFASRVPQDLGYAGFRVHYPIKTPNYQDEVIVFLGASYFRAVGKREVFGLSARGLAIDTALPSGEEFPRFREFWLVRPARGAKSMTILALLDSRRMTGAYRFDVYPGEKTVVKVECQLFVREPVAKLGIAPLTSMFFRGEHTLRAVEDYRPEVHDSDGLLLSSKNGEWIWRPLQNPDKLQVSSFVLPSPLGFGLIQRDRDFDHYQDFEARPDLRPSAWVKPAGEWGPGRVELVEIPTKDDTNDNIVAYWVPETPLAAGNELKFAYEVAWLSDDDRTLPPGGRVLATRRDRGSAERSVRFVIDFSGRDLDKLPPETVLEGVVTIGSGTEAQGRLLEQQVLKNPVTGGWRLVFQMQPAGDEPIDIRAFLRKGTDALTETWTYLLQP